MLFLGDILMAPAKGFMSILNIIHNKALEEMYDPVKIQEQLMHLQMELEAGNLSEDDYDLAEEVLLQRLQESRNRQT